MIWRARELSQWFKSFRIYCKINKNLADIINVNGAEKSDQVAATETLRDSNITYDWYISWIMYLTSLPIFGNTTLFDNFFIESEFNLKSLLTQPKQAYFFSTHLNNHAK
jgi:hypothetical protein